MPCSEVEEPSHQTWKQVALAPVSSVGAQVRAGDDDLVEARFEQPPPLFQRLVERKRPSREPPRGVMPPLSE